MQEGKEAGVLVWPGYSFFPHTIGLMGLDLEALTRLYLLSVPKSQKQTNKTRVGAVLQVTKLWYDITVKSISFNLSNVGEIF